MILDAPVQPQSLEAEENVLGAMMMSAGAIRAVSEILQPSDFFRASHGMIYAAIVDMHAADIGVDCVTVLNELGARGHLEAVGGKERVYEIAAIVPASANAKHYATIVRDLAVLRGLVRVGSEVYSLGMDRPEPDVDALLTRAEELVMGIRPLQKEKRQVVFTAGDVVAKFREKMAQPVDDSGIPTPFPSILRPLKGGRLYVMAGYTADGKTAAALQFLAESCRTNYRTDIASIEMSHEDLTDRLVAQFGIPHHMCVSGQISPEFAGLAEQALGEISGWDFEIYDDESVDVAALRRHLRRRRPHMLIVDHLHRFEWKERRDLELIVRNLTNLAREFEIPILLLAQLRRAGDWKDPFPRPSLSQLKESSVIEQEAFAVWFIWRKRDEFVQPTPETEFLIAKNRGGPLSWSRLAFKPQFVRFDSTGISGAMTS